ncbi:MAG TPA: hypothetical protein ENH15_04975, partial [Actinobacteria bacterium]|nr:hypothetical protein [Actinomycetota bacterium]
MRFVGDLIRTFVTFVVMVPVTAVAASIVTATAIVKNDSPFVEWVIRRWAAMWMWLAKVNLEVVGRENIDPSRSYVIISNHLSAFDIMAHFAALPVP